MHTCHLCQKDFKYPYLLLRHLNRKFSCYNSNIGELGSRKDLQKAQNGIVGAQNGIVGAQNGIVEAQNGIVELKCSRCDKIFIKKNNLCRHVESCKGNVLQCSKCGKTFSSRKTRAAHERNVNCSLISRPNAVNNQTINNNNQIINITYVTNNVKQYITYNSDKQSMISTDPNAPSPQLLCYNGFKKEICNKSLQNFNLEQLHEIIKNIMNSAIKNYDKLWRFFFRNIDNKHMQMFMLQKNNNATHANVFNEGNIEMINKNYLYKSLCIFVCKYILDLSFDYVDAISLLKNDQDCKKSFFQIIKEESQTFEYYKNWLCE